MINLKKQIVIFKSKCESIISSSIYDRHLFKETFKKRYKGKNNNLNYPINDNSLSNIIIKWKNNSFRFKKESVFYDTTD